MADYDDIFQPGKSIEEVGGSLLSRAQENAARRRRERAGPSTSDMLKGLGMQLAGHFVGDYFRSTLDNNLQEHLNSESELQRRALVKNTVNDANIVLEKNRAALAHRGGLKGYLIDERTASNLAYLQSKYADQPNVSQTAMKTLAAQQASDGIEDYMEAFQKRVTAAQKVSSVTGGDPLAYYNATREAAGAEQGLAVRGIKTLFSKFRDADDTNLDGALYRSATTQRIYKASEEYRNAFDKLYVQTASAEAASNMAEALKKTGDLPLAAKDTKPVSLTTTNEFGEQVSESWLQITGYDGQPESYVSTNGERISVSAWRGRKADSRQDGTRMSQKSALAVYSEAIDSLDSKTLGNLRTSVNAKLGSSPTTDQQNKVAAVYGEQIYLGNKSLSNLFGNTATRKQTMSIAVRAQLADRNAFDERPTLLSGNLRENPFTTWQATIEHFGGDYDDVPPAMRQTLEAHMSNFFTAENLKTVSLQELRDIRHFVDKAAFSDAGGIFGTDTSFRFLGANKQKLTIVSALDEIIAMNTR